MGLPLIHLSSVIYVNNISRAFSICISMTLRITDNEKSKLPEVGEYVIIFMRRFITNDYGL